MFILTPYVFILPYVLYLVINMEFVQTWYKYELLGCQDWWLILQWSGSPLKLPWIHSCNYYTARNFVSKQTFSCLHKPNSTSPGIIWVECFTHVELYILELEACYAWLHFWSLLVLCDNVMTYFTWMKLYVLLWRWATLENVIFPQIIVCLHKRGKENCDF